jgi:predicted methyltransferase
MRKNLLRSLALAAVFAAACQTGPATPQVTPTSANIVAALADPARPKDDTGTNLDVDRKPAEMLAFAGARAGMKVGELIPGQGYMTRLFSKAVGPTGKVYVFASAPVQREGQPPPPPPINAIQQDKTTYPNVSVITSDFTKIATPEPLDLVWTSQNYHDMHNPGRNLDINAANKAVLAALKPGGIYIVLDHATAPGVAFNAQLHRIDPDMVKKEVLAAGFEFVGESTVLRNAADPHDKTVFDPSIRHKTDQFIFKFRKPG